MSKKNFINRFPFFYGYIIIFSGTIGVLASAPGQTVGISVFTDFLIKDLGISRENLSLAYMLGTLSSSFLLTWAGKLFDRFGARITSVVSGLLLGVSLFYLSRIGVISRLFNNGLDIVNYSGIVFGLLVFGFFIVRFFGQGVLTMSSRNMVMKWFDTRRGMASAFMGIAISFGFSYSPRVFDWFIEHYGWQGAWETIAIIVGVGFVGYAIVFFRDNPEEFGLIPDGKKIESKKKNTPIYHPNRDYTLKEARRTYSFWIFNLSLALYVLYMTAFTFHIVDIFGQATITREDAIAIFLPSSVVALIFQVVSGYIADYIQLKYLLILKLIGMIISTAGFIILHEGIPVYLIILGNGIAGGIFGVISSITWPRFFGTKHLGEISGFNMSWIVIGSAVGPFLFSYLNNSFNGYYAAGIFCIVSATILLVLSFKADNVNQRITQN